MGVWRFFAVLLAVIICDDLKSSEAKPVALPKEENVAQKQRLLAVIEALRRQFSKNFVGQDMVIQNLLIVSF